VRPIQLSNDVAGRVLWLIVGGSVLWFAVIFAADITRTALIAPPMIIFGLAMLAHGTYRMRNPEWREHSWWSQHPMLALMMGGFRTHIPSVTERSTERGAASLQILFGAAMILAGIGAAIYAFA
jgi:hypothetical protein